MQQPSLARTRAMAYIGATTLKVLGLSSLEERLAALEERNMRKWIMGMSDEELVRHTRAILARVAAEEEG